MVLVFLAEGFEEIEAITPIDLLRRAEIDVVTVGVGEQGINGAHGIPVLADITDNQVELSDKIEMIVLPGGMPGTLNLEKSHSVQRSIDYCYEKGKYIAAICAAPSILGHKKLLDNKNAIAFPGFETQLGNANISNEYVVVDENIVTAKGAGVAMDFSLKLVELLRGKEQAKKLKKALQCR
ncbi:MAG: DJ-1/PfpI family protein [Clostridiales bacterium]|nr:DJ-1/PfpI family protein [Clostridiales bacterium]